MIKMIITIKRRAGMTHEEFVRYQREVHRPLLMAILEARRYVRGFVVSYPITAPSPPSNTAVAPRRFAGEGRILPGVGAAA